METNYNIPNPTLHLELGDWVSAKIGVKGEKQTPPMYVTGVFDDCVYLEIDAEQGDPFEYNYEDVSPIPLTQEIIEKNNLKNLSCGDKQLYIFTEYWRIVVSVKHGNSLPAIINRYHPRYVHELQHILRLCGITKQIIL